MRAGKREKCAAVVECRGLPCNLIVAGCAVMRELIRTMGGSLRAVEIRLMTLPAVRVLDVVIPAGVATDTRLRRMCPRQRKCRAAMVEG